MKYSKREIGIALKNELKKGYDVRRISNWADDIYNDLQGESSPEVKEILRHIFIMDAGPEFVYTEEELNILSEMLIHNEIDPIKKVNELASKRSTQ